MTTNSQSDKSNDRVRVARSRVGASSRLITVALALVTAAMALATTSATAAELHTAYSPNGGWGYTDVTCDSVHHTIQLLPTIYMDRTTDQSYGYSIHSQDVAVHLELLPMSKGVWYDQGWVRRTLHDNSSNAASGTYWTLGPNYLPEDEYKVVATYWWLTTRGWVGDTAGWVPADYTQIDAYSTATSITCRL
jgi:hypothetical protein